MQALLLHMPVYLHVHMLHQKYPSIIFFLAVFRLKIILENPSVISQSVLM